MSPIVLLILGILCTLRYVAYETGDSSMKVIGGGALVLLLITRYYLPFAKRKKL